MTIEVNHMKFDIHSEDDHLKTNRTKYNNNKS